MGPASDSSALLAARGVAVRRGGRLLLSEVDLDLAPRRLVHLAGRNGEGKTSLLRVVAGLARAHAGTVTRRGGWAFVPEKVALAPQLRGGEWLEALRALRGAARTDWGAAVEASGLDREVLARPAAAMSKGMLQRLALVEAFGSGSVVLALDEPFSGLDPEGRAWLAERVAAHARGGGAVVLTDHSGAALTQLTLTGRWTIAGGGCVATDPDAFADGAAAGTRVTVDAVDRAGVRRRDEVGEDEVDAHLRALLDAGWHIERVVRA